MLINALRILVLPLTLSVCLCGAHPNLPRDQDYDYEVINPAVYKILVERFPQLFDPNYELEKRYKTFEFGLGKRRNSFSFGLGKRGRSFEFGLGKRGRSFNFGIGKRDAPIQWSDEDSFAQGNSDQEKGASTHRIKRDIGRFDFPEENGASVFYYDPVYDENSDDKRSRTYSFGVGKRATEEENEGTMYQYGLGKRPISRFNFGLGKRSDDTEGLTGFPVDTIQDYEGGFDGDENETGVKATLIAEKRPRPMYEFGLGKRISEDYDSDLDKRGRMYSFGLGKRGSGSYEFGLGKRVPRMYEFGLGKRGSRMYGFGLGKRGAGMYEFGLGKRVPRMYEFGLGKRSRGVYEFGLGKRPELLFKLLDLQENGSSGNPLNKKSRGLYEFGLGKREVSSDVSEELKDKRGRRLYSFGLGKRAAYNFGLGKREDSTDQSSKYSQDYDTPMEVDNKSKSLSSES